MEFYFFNCELKDDIFGSGMKGWILSFRPSFAL